MLQEPLVRLAAPYPLQEFLLGIRVDVTSNDAEQFIAVAKHVVGHLGRFHVSLVIIPELTLHLTCIGVDKESAQVVPVLRCVVGLEHLCVEVVLAYQLRLQCLRSSLGQSGVVAVGTLRRRISVERDASDDHRLVEHGTVYRRIDPGQFLGVLAIFGIDHRLVHREVEEGMSLNLSQLGLLRVGHQQRQRRTLLQLDFAYHRLGVYHLFLIEQVGKTYLQVGTHVQGRIGPHSIEVVLKQCVAQLRAESPMPAQLPGGRHARHHRRQQFAAARVRMGVGQRHLVEAPGIGRPHAGKSLHVELMLGSILLVEQIGHIERGIGKQPGVVPSPCVLRLALRHVAALVVVQTQGYAPSPQRRHLTTQGHEGTESPGVL